MIPTDEGFVTTESEDEGRNWSHPIPVDVGPTPPGKKRLSMGPQALLNLADGSMLWFLLGGVASDDHPELTVHNWGATHCRAFSLRSTDDGRTWSPPTNLDNSAGLGLSAQCGNLDLTEVCSAQMSNGRVLALIRPVYSPWMWETWSTDGGASWGPCVRGPFPGYATPNMLRTASVKVLVAHRLPSMTIHCSPDEGHTWDEGTQVDGSIWVMGSMIEVEPDVVLYVYYAESLMRGQLIRVSPTGPRPAGGNVAIEEQRDNERDSN